MTNESKTDRSGQGNIKLDHSKRPSESRNWCFTSYNDAPPLFTPTNMKYLCYSPEICPTTKRKHFQGYCNFKNAKSISSASKCLGKISVFKCNGSPSQNRIYCGAEDYEKDGKVKLKNPLFVEHGVLPQQGKRTDLDELITDILEGDTNIEDIISTNPIQFHQYGRTLEKAEDIRLSKNYRTEMTTCDWIWGATGTGKSTKAFEGYSPDTHYLWKNDKGWWDKYKQQPIVIMNDFRGEIAYNDLLQLIDKWAYDVSRRGRAPIPFTSKHIIITSSLPPHKIYHHRMHEDSLEQLLRRINIIKME